MEERERERERDFPAVAVRHLPQAINYMPLIQYIIVYYVNLANLQLRPLDDAS